MIKRERRILLAPWRRKKTKGTDKLTCENEQGSPNNNNTHSRRWWQGYQPTTTNRADAFVESSSSRFMEYCIRGSQETEEYGQGYGHDGEGSEASMEQAEELAMDLHAYLSRSIKGNQNFDSVSSMGGVREPF